LEDQETQLRKVNNNTQTTTKEQHKLTVAMHADLIEALLDQLLMMGTILAVTLGPGDLNPQPLARCSSIIATLTHLARTRE